MKLRKVLALAAAAVMAVAALASCGVKEDSSNDSKAGGSSEKHYKIGIVQIMEHTSLNTIRDAVIDRLAELGRGYVSLAMLTAKTALSTLSRLITSQQLFSKYSTSSRLTVTISSSLSQHHAHSSQLHTLRRYL